MSLHAELLETAPGHFTVIVGDRFADHLMRDEALGVLAAVLFGSHNPPPYLKTYEQWIAWHRRYCAPDVSEPVALLSWHGRTH